MFSSFRLRYWFVLKASPQRLLISDLADIEAAKKQASVQNKDRMLQEGDDKIE
tara:strand:+ start:1684 stop:1842 length:159 start_codon:yes stop_codon:yes gene_type:complete